MRKGFKAFTLVEMLIVMGIIIILMAVGIASGRFAIRRANRIEHENAAEQIYQAMQSYYADNREYPALADPINTVEDLVTNAAALDQYIDDFDGGSDATYYYNVDGTGQVAIVCVSLGGLDDENQFGMFCTGNGVGTQDFTTETLTKEVDYDEEDTSLYQEILDFASAADWQPGGWVTTP